MVSEVIANHDDDDLDGYEYFHPVDILGFWVSELIDVVDTPRFWDPPPEGVELTEEQDRAKYGPWRSTRDLRPWSERHGIAVKACDHAIDAAVGVNRWLRYGMGDRAGRLETEFRALLPQLDYVLNAVEQRGLLSKYEEVAKLLLKEITAHYRDLGTAAINRDDGNFEEWFKFMGMMRSSLIEFLRCHNLLFQIVFGRPRGRVGDLLYRYMVAISDFECLLKALEVQIRRGSDEDYDRAVAMIWLSVEARQEFEETLTNRAKPNASYPSEAHEKLSIEATHILRRLERTFAERPSADLARTVWVMAAASSASELPIWDKEKRELRFKDVTCKRFRTQAVNQELVLQSFQESGWPPRIDDPLKAGQRYQTVKQLNKGNKIIKFRSDGRGDGICWELAQPPK